MRQEGARPGRHPHALSFWLLSALLVLGGAVATPRAFGQARVPDAEAAAAKQEKARLADADTVFALTQDGAILYSQDAIKLSGYQYCSQAVALAEAGDFRQGVRAASKALHLANTTHDPTLVAYANRDLAIVYSYSGQLEKAEEFAREAMRYQAKDPQLVIGPAYKVVGDVQTRRGDYSGAVLSYDTALANSSPRYTPLVQASLVNALIESGSTERARQLLSTMEVPKDPSLAAQFERTKARLLLAENKPEQARDAFMHLTSYKSGADAQYTRMWAWDGVARSDIALGQKQAAADASTRALQDVDAVRAKFRSEEFKMGLFSDLQSVFDRAVGLYSDVGNAGGALEVSERSRSRALLDAVRGRAALAGPESGTNAKAANLAALQGVLKSDERVVQFHSLPDRLQVWVVGPNEIKTSA
ncbi:MAG: hypothetical protein JSS56_29515, partial [Proteobacteria bacterium]|nr:hypothetical protein [Pseudomonadota bacterium]